ncbi:CbiX/SirB N-terminal domain-containing protein [Herbaspirillum sp. RTI4]|uniref:sirohydrochlorin chelatase n=1 Tax=Herbaspirillum sp. RTI4 TaxID=3048640 RepID=UPI002AB545E2|nr:CbiX/SirB N-terminal domain-containing protein [Herbaspirillum sp. RTI4]MDY7578159.1 CbiX/SirB N-terminal domain-containing protein [Herbaspirillum sp. RTI4]MEA9980748.1 CbiX/SirB N-terminal domain-containing protein [Herbaspirillum sp. RTI4]
MSAALVLFAHGARDPRWAEPFQRLLLSTRARLPQVRVELAFLELMEPGVPQLAAQLAAEGVQSVTLVPVFLGQGGHLRRDLPLIVEECRQAHPTLEFTIVAPIGEDDAVLEAIAGYCAAALPLK